MPLNVESPAAKTVLRVGFLALAKSLQEAADLSAGELRGKLNDGIAAATADSGQLASYMDHTGDANSGTVTYQHGSNTKQAPYSKGTDTSDDDYSVDASKAKNVTGRVVYTAQPDDSDCYAAMEAARLYTPGARPLCERFIPKSERDAADSSSFAGKGKSFPILKKEDVAAAVSSMGRAGSDNYSTDVIRKNITRIATAKGWASELPDSWKTDSDTSESARSATAGEVSLIESTAFPAQFEFRESAAVNPMVKIISAGRGSSGWYSKEVLQRDGPKIFDRGTLGFINHATKAEEAARPEGDWNKLAYVTTARAHWDENGKAGPALYAPIKIFAAHASELAEKAPHTGASIRASGTRDDTAIAPDGKPGVITSLTRGHSIDAVTEAGRDGKLLLESADSQLNEGGDMDATAITKLQEANRSIAKRLAKAEAREAAQTKLRTIRLPEASKTAIVERACADVPITESGEFDSKVFATLLEAEVQYAASLLPGGAHVVGLGAAPADPKLAEATRAADEKQRVRELDRSARSMGIKTAEGMRIFREGRSAFDPTYNSTDKPEVAA